MLRAVAVLAVFGVHARAFWTSGTDVSGPGPAFLLDRLLAQGAAGVDLFVVLSGFCLTYPLVRGRQQGLARIDTGKFYKRRAFRILPAYYAALGLLVVLECVPVVQRQLVGAPLTARAVLAHLLLLQPFDLRTLGAINGPFWSISLEVTLYLAFPLLLVALRRYGWAALVSATVLLACAWHGLDLLLHAVAPGRVLGGDLETLLPAHLFQFVLGMLAADMYCRPRRRQLHVAGTALLVGALLGAGGTVLDESLARTLGWGGAAFGLTVLACCTSALRLPALGRPVRALSRLGAVGYSFYLLHQPFLLLTAPLAHRLPQDVLLLDAVAFTVALGLMYLVATLWFRMVERPFLVAGGMRDAILPEPEGSATAAARTSVLAA